MAQSTVPINMILVRGSLLTPPTESYLLNFETIFDCAGAEFPARDFSLLRAVANRSGLLIRCNGGFSRFRSNLDRERRFGTGRLCGPMVAVL
jgi:hypothetical protein